jgi:hypothetical protein
MVEGSAERRAHACSAFALLGLMPRPRQFSDVTTFDEDKAVFFRQRPLFGGCDRTLEPNRPGAEWEDVLRDNSGHFFRRTIHADNVRAGGPAIESAESEITLLTLIFRREDAARIHISRRAGRYFSLRVAAGRITEDRETRFQQSAGHSRAWPVHQQDRSSRFENTPGICHILNTIIR